MFPYEATTKGNAISFKNIDVSPLDNNKVFIYDGGSYLYLYDTTRTYASLSELITLVVPYNQVEDNIPATFVRISRSSTIEGAIDIWVGAGVNLLKSTWNGDTDLSSSAWTIMKRSNGIHENCGYLGLDNKQNVLLYGCSGGLFKPVNKEATAWTRSAIEGSGLNSYAITDLAGTNVKSSRRTSLYFATKDNGIWASSDGGLSCLYNSSDSGFSLPYNTCLSGFSIQVVKDVDFDTEVTVAYGKFKCGDSPNIFSDANLENPRVVPAAPPGARVDTMNEAFFISPGKWIR